MTVGLLVRLRNAMDVQEALLAPDMDRAEILGVLASRARELSRADGASVVVAEEQALIHRGASGTLMNEEARPCGGLLRAAVQTALDTGVAALLRRPERAVRSAGRTGSVLAVPLPTSKSGAAVLLVTSGHGDAFAAHDQHLLGLIAPLAAARLDLDATMAARRASERRYNALLGERQRSFSEALQYNLLTDPPQSDHLQIAVRYRPASRDVHVGGDWYDAFVLPSGETVVVIGDVVGHDTEATVMMGQLRGLLRGIAYTTGDTPAELLVRLEEVMVGLELDTLATAIVARVEHVDGPDPAPQPRLRWSSAGHPPALLVHADGRVQPLVAAENDRLLGVDPTSPHHDHVMDLTPGCTVLLYTDGLVERRGADLDDGISALAATLAEVRDQPLERMCDEVLARVGHPSSEDDVALLAVRVVDRDRRPATEP